MDTPNETPVSELADRAVELMKQGGAIRIAAPAPDAGHPESHTFSGDVSRQIGATLLIADRLAEAAWEHVEAFSVLEDSIQLRAHEDLLCALVAYYDLRDGRPPQKFFKAAAKNGGVPSYFPESEPPAWLIGGPEGSTVDNRWFWTDHVLALEVGAFVDTDFQQITRLT